MFEARPPRHRAPLADDGAEVLRSELKATSRGRFLVRQQIPISPASFETGIDRLNAYFDNALFLQPLWSMGSDSGGGLSCLRRDSRTVPGTDGLRIRLTFSNWVPTSKSLMPPPLQTGPVRNWRKKRNKNKDHSLVFETDAGIMPWSDKHMVLVCAGLCAAFDWDVVGGLRQNLVRRQMASIRTAICDGAPFQKISRYPIFRKALTLNPLESLVTRDPGPQPTEPKG